MCLICINRRWYWFRRVFNAFALRQPVLRSCLFFTGMTTQSFCLAYDEWKRERERENVKPRLIQAHSYSFLSYILIHAIIKFHTRCSQLKCYVHPYILFIIANIKRTMVNQIGECCQPCHIVIVEYFIMTTN